MLVAFAALVGCKPAVQPVGENHREALIAPDYKEVTLPPNVAPLSFDVVEEGAEQAAYALLVAGQGSEEPYCFHADAGVFNLPADTWKNLLTEHRGGVLTLILCKKENGKWLAYKPFTIRIAEEEMDAYLVYRLIPPGYELWNEMGIYQRNLTTYEEKPIHENKRNKETCMNCHTFRKQDAGEMIYHRRGAEGGTYLRQGGKEVRLEVTPQLLKNNLRDEQGNPQQLTSSLVYPYWHPDGRHIAFSLNKTFQVFHANHANRIEVCDEASDVVVYDKQTGELYTSPLLSSSEVFETYPTFSPDGKSLYYCAAEAVDTMPKQYQEVKYKLYRIGFDAENHTFGEEKAMVYEGKSVAFPRLSPDGRFLAFTESAFGTFPIWHKDADIRCLDLKTGELLDWSSLNSDDVDSWHSWSSNGRWLVFSSRRDDGLYTHPYIAYIDKEGRAAKPFLLPQTDARDYYRWQMNSYNLPEFVNRAVR